MKIRLMGSPDLIQLWANELKKAYGITGKTYPNRNSHEVRYYLKHKNRKDRILSKLIQSHFLRFLECYIRSECCYPL